MARFRFELLLKKHRMWHLAEFQRTIKGVKSDLGFAVGYSKTWLLLHTLDKSTFGLNGYTAIRDEDIGQFRFFDNEHIGSIGPKGTCG